MKKYINELVRININYPAKLGEALENSIQGKEGRKHRDNGVSNKEVKPSLLVEFHMLSLV